MCIQSAVERVQKMEQYLNEIIDAIRHCPNAVLEDKNLKEKLEQLRKYYTDGQWMEDYERDERGELPQELKRGVLAEDTLWNLFGEIDDYNSQLPRT